MVVAVSEAAHRAVREASPNSLPFPGSYFIQVLYILYNYSFYCILGAMCYWYGSSKEAQNLFHLTLMLVCHFSLQQVSYILLSESGEDIYKHFLGTVYSTCKINYICRMEYRSLSFLLNTLPVSYYF